MSHTAVVSLVIPDGETDSSALSEVWSSGQARSALGGAKRVWVAAGAEFGIEVRQSYGSGGWLDLLGDDGSVVKTVADGLMPLPEHVAIEDIRFVAAEAVSGDATITISMMVC